jgi:type VI secretion system secreted protein Hcp
MAVNAYLIINGVNGPSTSLKNAIDIMSFSIGASMPHVVGAGSSGAENRAGRASISDLSIMKVADATSPILFGYCTTGFIISKVSIQYSQQTGATGAAPATFYEINLTNAMVTSYQDSGSSENPHESISFGFQTIQIGYNPESATGSQAGMVFKGYDLLQLQGS